VLERIPAWMSSCSRV